MPYTTTAKNTGAAAVAASITHISLHSADPGATGASELTGGSPAYARKVPAYSAASGGSSQLSASLVFNVPAGATVAFYGLWATATFLGGFALTSEPYTGQGTYTLTAATVTAN